MKLDSSDDIIGGQIFRSSREEYYGYYYLLNGQPGSYTAIGGRSRLCLKVVCGTVIVRFDRSLVTRLTHTVAAGTVDFLGAVAVHERILEYESDGDSVQQYYFKEIVRNHEVLGLSFHLGHMSGSLQHEDGLDVASGLFKKHFSQILPPVWQQSWFGKNRGSGQ